MTRKGIEYDRRHRRLVRSVGRADQHSCVDCGRKAIDWSQVHGTNGEQDDHYEPRCRSCHRKYDMNDEVRKNISEARLNLMLHWPLCVWGHDKREPGNLMKSGRCAECNRSLKRARRKGMTLAEAMEKEGRVRVG